MLHLCTGIVDGCHGERGGAFLAADEAHALPPRRLHAHGIPPGPEHIGDGVAEQSALVRDDHPADDEPASFSELVRVVAEAGPNGHGRTSARRSASRSSATCRSPGVVTLRFSGAACTTRTMPPLRST